MNNTATDSLLQEQGLKRTKLRVALLDCFFKANHAQSYVDIKSALGENVDKSTLYRNLTAFEEAGIIHRINDHTGVAKYALGKFKNHKTNHAHFVCEECETVYCLEEGAMEKLNVPKGFKTNTVQTILRGTCADC